MKQILVTIQEKEHDMRLDKALHMMLPEFTRSKLQEMIDRGYVHSDNTKNLNRSHKVKNGEIYQITPPPPTPSSLIAKACALNIVYEDEDILIINKQAGLTVHPGAGNYDDTLVNALLAHCGNNLSNLDQENDRPGIVHRLDKDTSGLMVVAKNDHAHASLAQQIESRTMKRQYLAVVYGVPKILEDRIETNFGRNNRDRTKMAVLSTGGKIAITNYQTEEIHARGQASLIRCKLDTGRTHQIRVHMAHIGNPIIGDQSYGNSRSKYSKLLPPSALEYLVTFKRQALHSCDLSVTHPSSKKALEFSIGLPDDIEQLIKKLNEK